LGFSFFDLSRFLQVICKISEERESLAIFNPIWTRLFGVVLLQWEEVGADWVKNSQGLPLFTNFAYYLQEP
jgi:hypothetical protein